MSQTFNVNKCGKTRHNTNTRCFTDLLPLSSSWERMSSGSSPRDGGLQSCVCVVCATAAGLAVVVGVVGRKVCLSLLLTKSLSMVCSVVSFVRSLWSSVTSAGASMTTKRGCQNNSASLLNSCKEEINALTLPSLKTMSLTFNDSCHGCHRPVTDRFGPKFRSTAEGVTRAFKFKRNGGFR